jgi:hypothetical protein
LGSAVVEDCACAAVVSIATVMAALMPTTPENWSQLRKWR